MIFPFDFNPRTPRGVRRNLGIAVGKKPYISIHAPREGCDRHTAVNSKRINVFQSTHPARGATLPSISISCLI